MKKVLTIAVACLVVAAIGIYLFRESIFNAIEPLVTSSMFVSEDTDSFDPGLPIGAQFPAIRALYQGREITGVDQFIRDKGAIFLANRSVDW